MRRVGWPTRVGRPLPTPTLAVAQAWICVLVNCLIVSVSTDQLDYVSCWSGSSSAAHLREGDSARRGEGAHRARRRAHHAPPPLPHLQRHRRHTGGAARPARPARPPPPHRHVPSPLATLAFRPLQPLLNSPSPLPALPSPVPHDAAQPPSPLGRGGGGRSGGSRRPPSCSRSATGRRTKPKHSSRAPPPPPPPACASGTRRRAPALEHQLRVRWRSGSDLSDVRRGGRALA